MDITYFIFNSTSFFPTSHNTQQHTRHGYTHSNSKNNKRPRAIGELPKILRQIFTVAWHAFLAETEQESRIEDRNPNSLPWKGNVAMQCKNYQLKPGKKNCETGIKTIIYKYNFQYILQCRQFILGKISIYDISFYIKDQNIYSIQDV